MASSAAPNVRKPSVASVSRRAVVLLGRLLFVAIFLLSVLGHFSQQSIDDAAAQGVPLARFAVPLSGVIALAGGLSILAGYRVKVGGWLIVVFLAVVTPIMHKFWAMTDPVMARTQMIMFMKNISLLGAALLFSQMGAGLTLLHQPQASAEKMCAGEEPIEALPGKGDFERWT